MDMYSCHPYVEISTNLRSNRVFKLDSTKQTSDMKHQNRWYYTIEVTPQMNLDAVFSGLKH